MSTTENEFSDAELAFKDEEYRDRALLIIDEYLALRIDITNKKLLYPEFGLTYEGVNFWRQKKRFPSKTSLNKIAEFFEFKNFWTYEGTEEEFLSKVYSLPKFQIIKEEESYNKHKKKILEFINRSWVFNLEGRYGHIFILRMGFNEAFSLYKVAMYENKFKLVHVLDGEINYQGINIRFEGFSVKLKSYISIEIDILRYMCIKKELNYRLLHIDVVYDNKHYYNIKAFNEILLSKKYFIRFLLISKETKEMKAIYDILMGALINNSPLLEILNINTFEKLLKLVSDDIEDNTFQKELIKESFNIIMVLTLNIVFSHFLKTKDSLENYIDFFEKKQNKYSKYYFLFPLSKKFKIKIRYFNKLEDFGLFYEENTTSIEFIFRYDENLKNRFEKLNIKYLF